MCGRPVGVPSSPGRILSPVRCPSRPIAAPSLSNVSGTVGEEEGQRTGGQQEAARGHSL